MKFGLRLVVCASLLLISACGKRQEATENAASASLAAAHKLYDAGQYQSAQSEVETAIKADPRSSDAHFLAGQISEKLGDLQTALKEYVNADAGAQRSEMARLAVAAVLIRAHAYNLAETWIARALAERPNDKAMKSYRALLNQRLGNSRNARADAEAILAENKGDVIANAVLAEEALRRKDPANALIRIEAGLSTDPSDKALLKLKADALLQQGLPDRAIEIYRALVAADPAAPDYRATLAELLAKHLGVEQGEQVLRRGIEEAPGNIEMHMQLVSFLGRHRDKKAVVDQLRAQIAATPDSTAFDIALADVYAKDNEFDIGSKVLNDAVARTRSAPARNAAQLALARLLIAHNDMEPARAILEGILKLNPTDDEALAVRGELMLVDRKPTTAIQEFLSIAGRQPSNPRAFALLADAYLQNDQPREAISALKRVLSLRPSDFEAVRRIVEIQIRFSSLQDANRTVDEFLQRNADSIDGQEMQTRLALQRKDWSTADAALTRLQRIPGGEQKAATLEAGMKEARGLYSEAAGLYRMLLLRKGDNQIDISAAQAFARTSIAAQQTSQSLDILTRLAANVPSADLSAYDLILASLYDSLGQSDKAPALVEAAIQIAPADPAPYLQQAASFVRKKEGAKALAILNRGIAAGAPKELLLLGRAEIQKSDKQADAILTYRDILSFNPTSTIAANEIANLLADQKPLDKNGLNQAMDLLQKNAPIKNQAILDTLAWSNYRLGNFEKAKGLIVLANGEQSSNPQVRFHFGAILVALGETKKGQEIIKNTVNEAYPGRDEAEKLLSD